MGMRTQPNGLAASTSNSNPMSDFRELSQKLNGCGSRYCTNGPDCAHLMQGVCKYGHTVYELNRAFVLGGQHPGVSPLDDQMRANGLLKMEKAQLEKDLEATNSLYVNAASQ